MEYMQMTLDDWANMKEQLKKDLIGVQESFVRIGYTLRQIEGQQLYEKDGYASIVDFAKAEYGLGASTVSRFIAINKKYSIDGNSDRLRPEFAQLGSSKLAEMLTLPDNDLEMIEPQATRGNIRELKQFNKQEPAAGVADDLRKLIEKFYEDNRKVLNGVFEKMEHDPENIKPLIELVNPGGNRSYKKGLFFLMMYETKISIKKFGDNPQEMTWEEFFEATKEIFPEPAGAKTWEKYFGQEDEDDEESPEEVEQDENTSRAAEDDGTETDTSQTSPGDGSDLIQHIPEDDETEDGGELNDGGDDQISGQQEENDGIREESSQSSGESITAGASAEPERTETEKEEIAPAQEIAETPGNTSVSEVQEEEKTVAEVVEKPFGSRRDYMGTLTVDGLAEYIAKECKSCRLIPSSLSHPALLRIWLKEEVDWNGEPLEEN